MGELDNINYQYDIQYVMGKFGISRATVSRHLKKGYLQGAKLGRKIKFTEQDILNYDKNLRTLSRTELEEE